MASRILRFLRGALLVVLAAAVGAVVGRLLRPRVVVAAPVTAEKSITVPSENVSRHTVPVPSPRHLEIDVPNISGISSEPYPTGYVARGRRVIVVMSDGTTRTDRDKELENVERNSVTLGGRKLFIRARPGSGVGATPVSPDGVPPGVVMRGQTGPGRAVGMLAVGGQALPDRSPPAPPTAPETRVESSSSSPVGADGSSWYVDSYGVSRLRVSPSSGR